VGEARQIGRLVEKFDPDQATAFGQRQLGKAWPMVVGQMGVGLGGIGPHLQSPFVGANGKDEARPERMRRAHEIAEIDGLGDALDANGEIATRRRKGGFHGSSVPQARQGQKGLRGRGQTRFSPSFLRSEAQSGSETLRLKA
jgi:hypothetical protein